MRGNAARALSTLSEASSRLSSELPGARLMHPCFCREVLAYHKSSSTCDIIAQQCHEAEDVTNKTSALSLLATFSRFSLSIFWPRCFSWQSDIAAVVVEETTPPLHPLRRPKTASIDHATHKRHSCVDHVMQQGLDANKRPCFKSGDWSMTIKFPKSTEARFQRTGRKSLLSPWFLF